MSATSKSTTNSQARDQVIEAAVKHVLALERLDSRKLPQKHVTTAMQEAVRAEAALREAVAELVRGKQAGGVPRISEGSPPLDRLASVAI